MRPLVHRASRNQIPRFCVDLREGTSLYPLPKCSTSPKKQVSLFTPISQMGKLRLRESET